MTDLPLKNGERWERIMAFTFGGAGGDLKNWKVVGGRDTVPRQGFSSERRGDSCAFGFDSGGL